MIQACLTVAAFVVAGLMYVLSAVPRRQLPPCGARPSQRRKERTDPVSSNHRGRARLHRRSVGGTSTRMVAQTGLLHPSSRRMVDGEHREWVLRRVPVPAGDMEKRRRPGIAESGVSWRADVPGVAAVAPRRWLLARVGNRQGLRFAMIHVGGRENAVASGLTGHSTAAKDRDGRGFARPDARNFRPEAVLRPPHRLGGFQA